MLKKFFRLCMAAMFLFILFTPKTLAYNTGDDYPSEYKNQKLDAVGDRWNFLNRECTSFVAWCLNSRNNVSFTNGYKGTWFGDASNWANAARSVGIPVDNKPAVGAVAWFSYGHVAWVESVNGGNVTIEEYNVPLYSGNYNRRTISSSSVSSFIHIKDIGGSGGSNPTGMVDSCVGGTGTIKVRGWAYDPDNKSAQLDIHVYIGGPAGSANVEGAYVLKANKSRPDVNKVYGVGDYHGYEETIAIEKTGTQAIYIYAINVGGGDNHLLGSKTVTIAKDNEAPKISNVRITDQDSTGYTVKCTVTDNACVAKVLFPTWVAGKTDAIWYTASISYNGSVTTAEASYRVKLSDLKNIAGLYYTDIYAYDKTGTQGKYASVVVPINMNFTVTFNANGGSTPTPSKTVTYNSNYGDLPTPTRAGYSFTGWFTAASGGSQVTKDTKVTITANQTLYAQWKPFTYTVKYNANGGTGATADSVHSYDSEKALTKNGFTKKYYTFTGWNTKPDGSGNPYADEAKVKNLTAENGKVITLYAQWKRTVSTKTTLDSHGSYTLCNVKISGAAAPCRVILAAYKGNKLISAETRAYSSVSESFAVSGDFDTVKVMVWNGLSGMEPISEVEVVKK